MAKVAPGRQTEDQGELTDFAPEKRDRYADFESLVLWLADGARRVRGLRVWFLSIFLLLTVGVVWLVVRAGQTPVPAASSVQQPVPAASSVQQPATAASSVQPTSVIPTTPVPNIDQATTPYVAPPVPAVAPPTEIAKRQAPAVPPAGPPRKIAKRAPAVPAAAAPTEIAKQAPATPSRPVRSAGDLPPRPEAIEVAPAAPPLPLADRELAPPSPVKPAASTTTASAPSSEPTTSATQSSKGSVTSSASPATGIEAETEAIRDVLGRYRSALAGLDPSAVRQVWPTVNQRTLERAFRQLQEQDVSFFSCTLDIEGGLAKAVCVGTTSFVPKVGNRSPQSGPSQWNFSLSKGGHGAWQIQDVQAR